MFFRPSLLESFKGEKRISAVGVKLYRFDIFTSLSSLWFHFIVLLSFWVDCIQIDRYTA